MSELKLRPPEEKRARCIVPLRGERRDDGKKRCAAPTALEILFATVPSPYPSTLLPSASLGAGPSRLRVNRAGPSGLPSSLLFLPPLLSHHAKVVRSCQTNSIITRRPTTAAARCRLERVMSFLGLRSRSTWVRLVLSRVAILFLDIFCFFMASSSCHATTSLTACACASSKIPSPFRKSSMLEPMWFLPCLRFLLIVLTPSGACAPMPNHPPASRA